jgi:hypothetical protein
MRHILILAVVVASACAPTLSQYTHQPVVTAQEDDLRERAGYELTCDADKLEVTALTGSEHVGPWSAGVSGCGKKAVYQFVAGAGWIANTAGTQ